MVNVRIGAFRNNNDKSLSVSDGNSEVLEKCKHVLPDCFVVLVNQGPILWFASGFPLANTGEDGAKDLSRRITRAPIMGMASDGTEYPARVTQPGEEILGPELFQVVSGSACVIWEKGGVCDRSDGCGELTNRESTWSTS